MVLIKENKQKKRQVWKADNFYRKIWFIHDLVWLEHHVLLLNQIVPDYVIKHGYDENSIWIDYKIIEGIPASTFPHTDEFVKSIYEFCLENIRETHPYAHGDWVLSNILVNHGGFKMIDWDNLNIYPEEDRLKKLHKDLRSAFGEKFDKVIKYDSAGI